LVSTSARPAERQRLHDADTGAKSWRRWGTYVSDRQWGTVREDYSADGDAWAYVPHDESRSRAYRWGEDALGGWCDLQQRLCLGIALWNGADPILKERLFGVTNSEGNHGEDVKEVYYHLDATPTHAYARMLYKYPQAAFPYAQLVAENRRRGKHDPEYELVDTGVFDENRYFDVEIVYAKADVDDVLWCITTTNRGPDPARLHVLPQIWFRNTWSWVNGSSKPSLDAVGRDAVRAVHATLGTFTMHYENPSELLFCDNDTNTPKLFGVSDAHHAYKDAFHAALVDSNREAVSSERTGTKATGVYVLTIAPGASVTVRARLSRGERNPAAFTDFDATVATRATEAQAFYADLQLGIADEDVRRVHRQAFAGMLWSKQYYSYDVPEWLVGDPAEPKPPPGRRTIRNGDWTHFNSANVLAVPDKWEYPWFAAWDWAFHLVTFALIDPHFAKEQLVLLCRPWFMHPNGQLPAYEWNFGDVNPPVHA
jgi:hypothetical protein